MVKSGMQISYTEIPVTVKALPAGPLPQAWAGMTAMQELYLHANNFTGRLPAEWASMTSMRRFYAPANMLTGLTASACWLKSLQPFAMKLQNC